MASDQGGVPSGPSEEPQGGGEVHHNFLQGGSESSRVRRNRGKSVTRWVQSKLRIRTSSKNEHESELEAASTACRSPTTQAAYLSSSMPFLDQAGSTSGDPGIGDGCRNGRQATISNSKLSWSRMKKRLAESLSHVGGGARALSSAPTARATATSRQDPSSITKRALPPVPAPSVEQVQSSAKPARLPPPPLPLIEGGGGIGNRPVSADDGWTGTPVVVDGDDAVAPAGDNDEDSRLDMIEQGGVAYFPAPVIDFATSIEKVKSYGWYWGPISRVASERLLSNEPDGSFIVRDSSADHYIFSLTFKLDNKCSHVRIENHHGNFSFGSLHNFKSNTIVDFIENAVEHSRSGRYLFFLHRRPQRGPMRVQLKFPVSRFKTKDVQSLQHMCRFVILKKVPRDLLHELKVPKRILAYLDTPFYYSEQIADWADLEPQLAQAAAAATATGPESEPIPTEAGPTGPTGGATDSGTNASESAEAVPEQNVARASQM